MVKEWLMKQGYDCIKLEYAFGNSLMDFYMEKGKQKYLMEVKGCTLEIDGVGYFPDAPTERGVKHLRELAAACGQGYKCLIAFVIQMEGISEVRTEYGNASDYQRQYESWKNACRKSDTPTHKDEKLSDKLARLQREAAENQNSISRQTKNRGAR